MDYDYKIKALPCKKLDAAVERESRLNEELNELLNMCLSPEKELEGWEINSHGLFQIGDRTVLSLLLQRPRE